MNIKLKEQKVNEESELFASYDVGSEEIHFCTEYKVNDKTYNAEEIVTNKSRSIRNHLLELDAMRIKLQKETVHVFCEPTGGYEKTLISVARKMNYKVSYVSSEATKKGRVIESNDNSKCDKKDKYIVLSLAQMSKVLNCRQLPTDYSRLRILGEYYDDISDNAMRIRTEISSVKRKLFPDFPFKCSYIYSKTGEALIDKYGLNPFKITKYSWSSFWNRMKQGLRQPNKEKLKEIYRNATSTVKYISDQEAAISEEQLTWLWKSYKESIARKETLKEEICSLYRSLPEYEKLSKIKDISESLMGRLVAETGPLRDFKKVSQILRYAGLNIRNRQSGKYKGLDKISKKGRSLLRKVLFQMVFAGLMSEGKMFHDDYVRKKEKSETGLCAMVMLMRKALKMIYGVSKSNICFDIRRVQSNQLDFIKLEKTA